MVYDSPVCFDSLLTSLTKHDYPLMCGPTAINWSGFMRMWRKWFRIKFVSWFFSVGHGTNVIPQLEFCTIYTRWLSASYLLFRSLRVGTWERMESRSCDRREESGNVGESDTHKVRTIERWVSQSTQQKIIAFFGGTEGCQSSGLACLQVPTFHFPSLQPVGLFRSLIECKWFVQRKWI